MPRTNLAALSLLLVALSACASPPPPAPVARAPQYQPPAKPHVAYHKPPPKPKEQAVAGKPADTTVAEAAPQSTEQMKANAIPNAGE